MTNPIFWILICSAWTVLVIVRNKPELKDPLQDLAITLSLVSLVIGLTVIWFEL